MLISKTGQYAIQSMIYIATQPRGTNIYRREVASKLQVPAPYLGKIMDKLCKGGLLTSFRGRFGGFCLNEDPAKIDLMRILQITEPSDFTKACMLGLKGCTDEIVCPMHSEWELVKEAVTQLLHKLNLSMLSEAVSSGKYRISDIPYALIPDTGLKAKVMEPG